MINNIQNSTYQKSLKLPIRLRLKRPSHSQNVDQSQQNPQYSLHEILHAQNIKLRDSVNQLSAIQMESKGVSDRESEKKKKRKDDVFLGAVGVMKEILKYLYKQTEDMALKQFSKKGGEQKERQSEQLPKGVCLGQERLDDRTQQYSQLFRMYNELKSEVSEMEHYIIRLKQELNTKQKQVQDLETKNKMHGVHNTTMQHQLTTKDNQCRIMKEEILGYEQKIQNLESELIETRRCKSDRVFTADRGEDKKSEGQLNEANEGSQSSIQKVSAVSVGEESLDDSQFRKDVDNSKLDEIFDKTERVLKKCKLLQEKLEIKESEISSLKESLSKIVQFLGLKPKDEGQSSSLPSAHSIITQISSKINQTFDKLSIRQTQIETMISKQLNQILTQLSPHKNYDQITIHEKIQWILQRVKDSNVEQKPQQYIDLLLNLHSQIEDVITHAGQIEHEMNKNNDAVAQLIDEVVERESLINSLKEMEDLLVKNEHSFTDENLELFQHFKAICAQNGLDASKINSYLTELEAIVKGMHKNHSEQAQKYEHQIQELKIELDQLKGTDLKQKSEEVLNLKQKMMTSFYPSSPEFVESILQRIVEVKNSHSTDDIEKLVSNIFEEIREKDEKFKLQMTRKKEVMKQRSAAISQICRKGISIKDSSHEIKNKPSLDDS